MSLSLKVPELSDKPLIIAETRPHKIAEFITKLLPDDALESAHLLSSATTLFEELEIINRQKIAADDRMRAMEAYRPAVTSFCKQLAEYYCAAPLPLPEQAKKHASLAESLWLELSYGYKLVLLDQQKRFFSLKNEKRTSLIIQRAMDAMRELALVYHQTYFSLPATLWSDLNQLYFYAAQHELHELNTAEGDQPNTSISLSYKKILLMAIADPQRLSSQDIKRVIDYISRYASHAQFKGLGLIDNPAGIFYVYLHSDSAPVAYTKHRIEANPKYDIFLVTVDLARLVYKQINQLKSELATATVDKNEALAETTQDPSYLDLLSYLIKHWSQSPKRLFDRKRRSESMEIGIGISAAHYFYQVDKGAASTDTNLSAKLVSDTESTGQAPVAVKQKYTPSRWVVLNLSAGGIALRKPPSVKENLRVGSLLCIRDSTAKHWSVGVVRWAANNEDYQIDIGTQLISPTAKPIAIRKLFASDFDKALLLPGIAVLKQLTSILAPSGFYSLSGELEIEEAGTISRIVITKLVERTNSFEHFNFNYL